MHKILGLLLFAALADLSLAGEIALTFDDAPRLDGQYFSGEKRTSELIKKLRLAKVQQVAFYCTPRTLTPSRFKRLEKYAASGHIIANHTDTHPDIRQTPVGDYLSDIAIAHYKLSSFSTFKRWFRFPFLREGNSVEKRDKVRNWLTSNKYINGYVTVDNYDWYMNKLLQDGLKGGRKVNYDNLKKVYIETLWKGIEFYDDIAVSVLGRSPKHVLLLHENDLAALFVDELAAFIRSKNWKIISPAAAYKDPIAGVEPDTLFLNQGRVAAIAHIKGYKPSRLVSIWEEESVLEKLFDENNIFESKTAKFYR